MAEQGKKHTKEYMFVFFLLFIGTVVEIYIPEIVTETFAKGSALTALAVVKAFLVAWYFMHLKMEKMWLIIISVIPVSAALYCWMVIAESLAR